MFRSLMLLMMIAARNSISVKDNGGDLIAREVLNPSTCLWVHHKKDHTRSGNKYYFYRSIRSTLARCSGVYVASDNEYHVGDAFAKPAVLFGINTSVSYLGLIEDVLIYVSKYCEHWTINWTDRDSKCRNHPESYSLLRPSEAEPNRSKSTHMLDVLYHDPKAWAQSMRNVLVMYFRGEDILRPDAHPLYHQAPCCLFKQAYRISHMEHTMLIYNPQGVLNPCIAVMKWYIPKDRLLDQPCVTTPCAMNLLGRAPELVTSGVSTFVRSAIDMFGNDARIVYDYFCDATTANHICITGNKTGLIPWSFTNETLTIMLTRNCSTKAK